MSWFRFKKIEEESTPRIFIEHEVGLGRLSRLDRSLDEAASADPGSADFSGHQLGLSIPLIRFKLAFFILTGLVFLLAGRSAYLQVVQGANLRTQAEENRFQVQYLSAERGIITDRNNKILAENAPAFTLTMTIADLPESQNKREEIFDRVVDLTGMQRADLDLLLQDYSEVPSEEIIIEKDLGYEQALLAMIETPHLPGFSVRATTKRHYETSAISLSHILGYVGKISVEEFEEKKDSGYRRTDEIGKTGIEAGWESDLRGNPGKRLVEVDAAGNETTIFSEELPVKGAAITLAIDLELQKIVEQSLTEITAKAGQHRASAVVMDPNNGEVLALVSLPSFDNNLFAGGIDKETYTKLSEDSNQPLFPRAVLGEFPSGSTFKPYVAAAALAEGIITPTTSFLSTGGLSIGVWFFPDWKAGGHGITDVKKAIAESINTFFYIVGGGYNDFVGLGVERITSYAKLFGFGEKTGIDLPSEADGFLPSKEWKEEYKNERWYVGDTYHLAIGQGDLLTTPIQMATALCSVANGGVLYTPHVARAINNELVLPEGEALPDNLREALKTVRQGMRQTVISGSARRLNTLPITSAGKTGTAQIGGTENTHAWYTGFAPYENPEIAVVVMIEEGGEGSSTAVVVAEDIFKWWYNNRREKD